MESHLMPFKTAAERILHDLSSGHSVSVTGLSNTGKSTLVRGLAGEQAAAIYQTLSGRQAILVYVDCNQAVAISAQAFYEIVLRSMVDQLGEILPDALEGMLRDHHQSVTQAETSFTASLAFNLALTEISEQMDCDVCLMLDEFDELYAELDERALLNMRAIRDRFRDHLTYLTATIHSLPEIRGSDVEGEFAELFSHTTYPMPLLSDEEALDILQRLELPGLQEERMTACKTLAGGHPGLLIAIAQVIARLPQDWVGEMLKVVVREPYPRAECLKIWEQLNQDERQALLQYVLESDGDPEPTMRFRLDRRGIMRQGQVFSPVFQDFIARRGRGADVREEGIYLDVDSGDVWVDGVRIPVLTDLEFRLMRLLYDRQDKLTDKYRIVTAVWGEAYLGDVDDARVEKLISRLRSKIEPDPSDPRYLITQRGRGYKLTSRPRNE